MNFVNTPHISLKTFLHLFPGYSEEATIIAENGIWFYSVKDESFISYLPAHDVIVTDVPIARRPVKEEEIEFSLRRFSSVYELKTVDGFPSRLLASTNLVDLIASKLDISEDLTVGVHSSPNSPIIVGAEKTVARTFINVDKDEYRIFQVADLQTVSE